MKAMEKWPLPKVRETMEAFTTALTRATEEEEAKPDDAGEHTTPYTTPGNIMTCHMICGCKHGAINSLCPTCAPVLPAQKHASSPLCPCVHSRVGDGHVG